MANLTPLVRTSTLASVLFAYVSLGKLDDESEIELLNYTDVNAHVREAFDYGANMVMGLLKDVEKDIPAFRFAFSTRRRP